MSKMPAKKKSCFQITSVIQAQVGSGTGVDDAESLDDPDENRTEDAASEIFEMSRGNFDPDACDQNQCDEDADAGNQRAPGGPGPQAVGCSSRFRVIKLDHGTGEPFRRGRWMCAEFYDKEPEGSAITGRTSGEHLPDRDSGLGVSVAPQSGQPGSDASGGMDPAAVHHQFEPINEVNMAVPPHSLLTPGQSAMNHASLLQKSPGTPQLYPNPVPPNPHHVPPNLDFHAQRLSLPLKVPGEVGMAMPGGQPMTVPNLIEWAGVVASLAPASSLQYSGQSVPAGLPGGGVSSPGIGRRKSDTVASAGPEDAGLGTSAGVNSLFGITIPIDGDEDR